MTPEYTPETIAIVLRCLRVQTEGPGPICPVCVHQTGLVAYDEQSGNQITAAGHFVLALAADRDLWRLRCEWQEACHKWERAMRLHHRDVVWDDEINRLECDAVQARTAYVAAGGTP